MQELLPFRICSVLTLPGSSCGVQHCERSEDICLNKYARILDGTVYMALGGKMHNAVNIILLKDFADCFRIADISFYKCIVVSVLDILEVLEISGVCKFVHIDNADLIAVFFEHIVNVI